MVGFFFYLYDITYQITKKASPKELFKNWLVDIGNCKIMYLQPSVFIDFRQDNVIYEMNPGILSPIFLSSSPTGPKNAESQLEKNLIQNLIVAVDEAFFVLFYFVQNLFKVHIDIIPLSQLNLN